MSSQFHGAGPHPAQLIQSFGPHLWAEGIIFIEVSWPWFATYCIWILEFVWIFFRSQIPDLHLCDSYFERNVASFPGLLWLCPGAWRSYKLLWCLLFLPLVTCLSPQLLQSIYQGGFQGAPAAPATSNPPLAVPSCLNPGARCERMEVICGNAITV